MIKERCSKLCTRIDGPSKIIKKIIKNAYKVKLPDDWPGLWAVLGLFFLCPGCGIAVLVLFAYPGPWGFCLVVLLVVPVCGCWVWLFRFVWLFVLVVPVCG